MSTDDTARDTQKLVGGGLLVAVALGVGQLLACRPWSRHGPWTRHSSAPSRHSLPCS